MFQEPDPTPFDLRWRMFGTDIRVHPFFWVMSVLLGWDFFNRPGGNVAYLLLWVLCVFLSILLHEFGHVIVGRLFGSDSHILLHAFGGLAIGIVVRRRWQRILVSFGGPVIQLLLWLGLWLSEEPLLSAVPLDYRIPVAIALKMLLLINLFWPLFNLLPIWPLDGGQVTQQVFEGIWGEKGNARALLLSGIVAGVLAAHCLMAANGRPLIPYWPFLGMGSIWNGILFAMLAVQSFQLYQIESSRQRYSEPDDRLPWER